MPLIIDPDNLNQGTEVTINTTTLKITLNLAGNLSADGVTGQALYSFLKEEWRTDATKIQFLFPMEAIGPEKFEFINGWELINDASRKLVRTAGWREVTAAGAVKREYLGVITLGNIDATSKTVGDKAYYAFANDTSATQFTYAGPVDEAVQTFGDASNGNFDKRTQVLTVFIRIQGKTYGSQRSTQIGVASGATLDYIARRFPLSEATDLNITASDATIDTTAPYTGMSITYEGGPISSATLYGASDLFGGPYNFGVVIQGNGGTKTQIYEWMQRQLRKTTNIDADGTGPTKPGNLQSDALAFVGSRLDTLSVVNVDSGGNGVAIDNFDANDTNDLRMVDNTGAYRTFPFVAAGSLNFNANLVTDGSAIYRMFFTTNPAGNFGTSTAVLVNDNSGTPISGTITGASVSFNFDYDGNNQGGRTPATNAPVTIVAIGLNTAQYVVATGTITRATGLSFGLVSALERNYSNP